MSNNYFYNNLGNNIDSLQNNNSNIMQPNQNYNDLSYSQASQQHSYLNNSINNYIFQNPLINDEMDDKMHILKYVNNSHLKNFTKIKCPACGSYCSYGVIKKYMLHIKCRCGNEFSHNLIGFRNVQNNIEKTINCFSCNEKTDENDYFYCTSCKTDLCNKCRNNHYKDFYDCHQIIKYSQKNFFCLKHGEEYISFCKSCNKNICVQCESKHKDGHEIIEIISDIRKIEREIDELKNSYNEFNNIKNKILENFLLKCNIITESFEIYIEILNSFKKFRNYETYINQKDFNMNFNKELSEIINADKKNNIFKTYYSIIDLSDKISNPFSTNSINNNIYNIENILQEKSVENIHIENNIDIKEPKNIENINQKIIKSELQNSFQYIKIIEKKDMQKSKSSDNILSKAYANAQNAQNNLSISQESSLNISPVEQNIDDKSSSMGASILDNAQIKINLDLSQNNENLINESNNNLYMEEHIIEGFEIFSEKNINESENEYELIQERYRNTIFFEEYDKEIDNKIPTEPIFESEFEEKNQGINQVKPKINNLSTIKKYQPQNSNAYSNINKDASDIYSFIDLIKENNKVIKNKDKVIINLVQADDIVNKIFLEDIKIFISKIISIRNYFSNLWNYFSQLIDYYKNNYFDLLTKISIPENNFWNNLYIKLFNFIQNYLKENNIPLSFVHKKNANKNNQNNYNAIKKSNEENNSALALIQSNEIKIDKIHKIIKVNINQTRRKNNFDIFNNTFVCYSITQHNSGFISINHQGTLFHLHLILSRYCNKIVIISFLFDCVILIQRKKNGIYLFALFPLDYAISNIIHKYLCWVRGKSLPLNK